VNIAWKLGLVLRGEAGEGLLDTYQTEREPHVRAVTETAIAMGRVVCMPDPAMAAQRDAMMLAQRAAGEQPVPPADPQPGPGVFVAGAAKAASIFPQDEVGGRRLDDVMGRGVWLIARRGADVAGVGGKLVSRVEALDGDELKPFAAKLGAYLDGAGADAVIGGHPHVTQDIEIIDGKPVIYSVGNFVMKETDNDLQRRGWVLRLELDKKGVRLFDTRVAHIRLDGVPERDDRAASPCWKQGDAAVGQCLPAP
jgi:hypothetical protein